MACATTNFTDMHSQWKRSGGFRIDVHLKNVCFRVLVLQKMIQLQSLFWAEKWLINLKPVTILCQSKELTGLCLVSREIKALFSLKHLNSVKVLGAGSI